jgi:hypothetical protein
MGKAVLRHLLAIVLALSGCGREPDAPAPQTRPLTVVSCRTFGPQTFTRTAGAPNDFTVSFSRANSAGGPFKLRIVNGDPVLGDHRVSSAKVTLNGATIAGPSDFDLAVALIERPVSLLATNTLKVHLASLTGSYLTIDVTDGDAAPPSLTITSPTDGALVSISSLAVLGTVSESSTSVAVNGKPASVSQGTFSVSGIPLQEGTNTLTATATDVCGNSSAKSVTVVRDTTPPALTATVGPVCAQIVRISGSVSDAHGPVSVTASGPSDVVTIVVAADGTFAANATIPAGLEQIELQATDALGNTTHQQFALTPVVCAPADQCHLAGVCNPATGLCSDPVRPNGSPCNDLNACTLADTCQGGSCQGGSPVSCPPAQQCHQAGVCDPATGTCSSGLLPDSAPCDDQNACTQADHCQAGICLGGNPVVCVASDQCHQPGVCDQATGICSKPAKPDDSPCNDQNACTGGDKCVGGLCAGSTAVTCAPSDQCHGPGTCDPGTGACTNPAKADGTTCSDQNACTQDDHCQSGVCVGANPVVCAVSDQCREAATCDPGTGTCSGAPRPDGTSCNDGDACTSGDSCSDGACIAGASKVCSASDDCHLAGTCDPGTGACSNPAKDDNSLCDDQNLCTVMDLCKSGVCTGAGTPVCAEADQCHQPASCNALTGTCVSALKENGSACDDGSACTQSDGCLAGVCVGNPIQCGISDSCHQPGTCNPATGTCSALPKQDGTACDDGNPCTTGDGCAGGTCAGTAKTCPPSTCQESWSCDPATGDCLATPGDPAQCHEDEGMVVGQALADASGAPLGGVTVKVGTATAVTKADGRYALPAKKGVALVMLEKAGFTRAERSVLVAAGVGTVAIDARLTLLAPEGTTSGNLDRWGGAPLVATVESGRLTPVSAQGLPGLLPPGWSPLGAFDVQVASPTGLTIQNLVTTAPMVYLVRYDTSTHQWRLESTLAPGAIATATLPASGGHALVVPDAPGAPAAPALGEVLPGLEPAALSPLLTAFGAGQPQVLPAAGGLVEGRIVLPASMPLPSSTVLSVAITESYNLTAGTVASARPRTADVILFRTPIPTIQSASTGGAAAVLGASFAITPSRSYTAAALGRGNVHVDVLAGQQDQRGKLGGRDAVTVVSGDASLSVAAGSLPNQTVVDVQEAALPDWVPRAEGLVPLAAVTVDLAGATLTKSAELSVGGLSPTDGATVLLARLERVDGVAAPVVVAIGTAQQGRWVFPATEGLPGLVQEGEHVIYESTALGFVAGVTRAAGAPVQALVSTETAPFVVVSGVDGHFQLAARPGAVMARARVPGTNLSGTAGVTIGAGDTATADIDLQGVVTVATVAPANGAVGVLRSTQVQVTTSAPLDSATVTPENFRLFQGAVADGVELAVRVELAASGASVAVIPEAQLLAGTAYTLQASGSKDVYGQVVVVPATTFTTKVEAPPSYDTGKIDFSMPDADGVVTISMPPGTLPPGTTILLTNEGNGIVVSFTVGNDGSLTATFLASIDDRLVVTVIAPDGSQTTFTRSQYVGPDGTVAIGPGGGVVRGQGGIEVRVPEGAVERGTTFKIAPFGPDAFPERPPFQGLNFGSGLRVEINGSPLLRKEIDLAFPKPADAPADAAYYIYRRAIPLPGEAVAQGAALQVIDHAFVEGAGANAKVVTASPPFSGVKYLANNVGPGPSLGPEVLLHKAEFFLVWNYPRELLGFVPNGLVTGKVLQAEWNTNPNSPTYKPIQEPLVVARADDPSVYTTVDPVDGSYALWTSPTGGDVRLVAYRGAPLGTPCPDDPATTSLLRCVTAVKDEVFYSQSILRQIAYGDRIWKANILFPAAQPQQPPSLVDVRLFKDVNGQRQAVDGLALENKPILFGFKTNSTAQVTSVEVLHHGAKDSAIVVRNDPLAGTPSGVDQVADYTPGAAGLYTVSATAVPLPTGSAFTVTATFRVVAAGGDVTTPVPDEPPVVLAQRTVPATGSQGVPITVAPQVVFSEPVKNVKDTENSVWLTDGGGGHVEASLTGINLSGAPVSLDAANGPSIAVTSVIVTPRTRLAYGRHYVLRIGSDIFDLDNTLPGAPAAPRPLVVYTASFDTVNPAPLLRDPPNPAFSSPGIASFGDRAYVVENVMTHYGLLKVFDLSDPTAPAEVLGAQARMLGRPMDLAAERESEGVTRVVVATGPDNHSLPSNIRLYRVHDDGPSDWIGAASLTTTAAEGIVQAVAMLGDVAYTASTFKGIQIVDLAKAQLLFDEAGGDVFDVRVPLNTDGSGFGREAVVTTIPVKKGTRPAFLTDIKAASLNDGFIQPMVLATGDVGLVVVNPQTGQIRYPASPGAMGLEMRGKALDVGRVGDRDIAVVVGENSSGPVLVVVDLSVPSSPNVLHTMGLDTKPLGVKLSGLEALVGSEAGVTIVHLDNPNFPMKAGQIPDLGARVAVAESGIVVTAMPDASGQPNVRNGGVRTATLGVLPVLRRPGPVLGRLDGQGNLETLDDVPLHLDVYGATSALTDATIVLEAHSQPINVEEHVWPLDFDPIQNRAKADNELKHHTKLPPGHRYFFRPKVAGKSGELVELVVKNYDCEDGRDTLSGDVPPDGSWSQHFAPLGKQCLKKEFRQNLGTFVSKIQTNGQKCDNESDEDVLLLNELPNPQVKSKFFDPDDGDFMRLDDEHGTRTPFLSMVRPAQRQYLMFFSKIVSEQSAGPYTSYAKYVDPIDVPRYHPSAHGFGCWKAPVNICWAYTDKVVTVENGNTVTRLKYNKARSIEGAKTLFAQYGTGDNPVSPPPGDHSKGLAADVRVTWRRSDGGVVRAPDWTICDKNGLPKTIPFTLASSRLLHKDVCTPSPTDSCRYDNGDNPKLRDVAFKSYDLGHVGGDPNHWCDGDCDRPALCPIRDPVNYPDCARPDEEPAGAWTP